MVVNAIPANRKDYPNEDMVLADWDAGQEFLTVEPVMRFIVKDSKPADMILNVSYDRMRKTAVIK